MRTEILMAEREQAEKALGQSEERYRRLLRATTDYIYTVRVQHGRSLATTHGPGCAAVTGYSSAEFANDPFLWYRVIHEEDREAVLAQAQRILEGESPPPLEHRLIHKRGAVRWIRNTPIPHRDARGRLVSYDGLITDITHRKRAELLLAAEYTVTRDLLGADSPALAMPRVLYHLCQILLWHHAAYWVREGGTVRREIGFWRAPLSAAEFEPAMAGRRLAVGCGLVGRVCAGGRAPWVADVSSLPELESKVLPSGAGLRCTCAFPIRTNHEMMGAIELYSRDPQEVDECMLEVLAALGVHIGQFIERRRSGDDLKQERTLLRTLIDNLPDCICVKDARGRYLVNNLAHVRMLGAAAPEAVLGRSDRDYCSSEDAARHRTDEERVLRTGQPLLNHEEPVTDTAGRQLWFLCTKVPLKNPVGASTGTVCIGHDITHRKRAEQAMRKRGEILKTMVRQLKSSQRQLEKAQKQLIQAAKLESVGTLAAGVAHEVKNPLQTILLGLHYLSGKFSDQAQDVVVTLSEMRDAVERANGIIRELLTLSAASEFERQPADLNIVIEHALRLLKNELMAGRVQVNQDLSPALPDVPIDAGKMEQVFINLCLNALHAMPDGGTLSIATRSVCLEGDPATRGPLFNRFKPGDQLVLTEVRDTGPGIPKADLPKIFDPFFTTKPVGFGTGLGLAVSLKIVDLHGGAIEIRNRPGGGVQATVVLTV